MNFITIKYTSFHVLIFIAAVFIIDGEDPFNGAAFIAKERKCIENAR
jgi:hypothetical protein